MADPFLGQIIMFGGNFAPRGWALCNGQILPINSYQALFSILGTIYGGDGETTFGLPDLRGRAPVSAGNGPGLSNYQLGQKGGVETVTLTAAQTPSHSHDLRANSAEGNTESPAGAVLAAQAEPTYAAGSSSADMAAAITSAGSGQAHSNIAPYGTVNYIICLQGTFPSPN